MDSRLVRKLAHALHHAAPPRRHQKNVTGRKIGEDPLWFSVVESHMLHLIFSWVDVLRYSYLIPMYPHKRYPDRIPQDKIPTDKIPTDKIPQDRILQDKIPQPEK